MAKKTTGQERQSRSSAAGNFTERKRVEDVLLENDRRLRAIIEAAPIPMVISRVSDGLILNANAHLGSTFGLPSEDMVGRKTPDFYYDPADRDAMLDLLKKDGYVRNYEVRAKKADGTPFWVVVSLQTTTFDGEPALVAGFYDITERKRAEDALRESEERYRALVETSPDGISLTDLEGRVLYCNKQALALLGFKSMQEVLGRNSFDLIAPEDRQRAVDNAQETLKMKSLSQIEYTLIRKDGSRVPVELGASLVVDAEDKPKGFIGVVRDITARKRAEESLRESEERFRKIFVEGPLGMAVVGLDYRLVRVNQTLCRMLGYSEAELTALTFPDITHPEDIDADVQLAERVFSGEIPHYKIEKRFIRQDGETVWGSMTAAVIRDERGNPLYGLGMVEDITDRKRAEEALQEAREELESRVEAKMQRGNPCGLTFRELTVIHLVAAGKPDKEIGALLGISPRTANKHVQNILTKMSASSRTEAGVRAVREGLVD
jgi:PAS domain S-box-containing protein